MRGAAPASEPFYPSVPEGPSNDANTSEAVCSCCLHMCMHTHSPKYMFLNTKMLKYLVLSN